MRPETVPGRTSPRRPARPPAPLAARSDPSHEDQRQRFIRQRPRADARSLAEAGAGANAFRSGPVRAAVSRRPGFDTWIPRPSTRYRRRSTAIRKQCPREAASAVTSRFESAPRMPPSHQNWGIRGHERLEASDTPLLRAASPHPQVRIDGRGDRDGARAGEVAVRPSAAIVIDTESDAGPPSSSSSPSPHSTRRTAPSARRSSRPRRRTSFTVHVAIVVLAQPVEIDVEERPSRRRVLLHQRERRARDRDVDRHAARARDGPREERLPGAEIAREEDEVARHERLRDLRAEARRVSAGGESGDVMGLDRGHGGDPERGASEANEDARRPPAEQERRRRHRAQPRGRRRSRPGRSR